MSDVGNKNIYCDIWEQSTLSTSPNNTLYGLKPIGVGTPYVESLTGYISRIAQFHQVNTGTLINKIVIPQLNREFMIGNDGCFYRDTKSLNGTGKLAKDLADALTTLTGCTQIHFLTMHTWSSVLSPMRLFRKYKAWCPLCLNRWKSNKIAIYDPLLWTFNSVTCCIQHHVPLTSRCPNSRCGRPQPFLHHRSIPGHCPYCGGWLGKYHFTHSTATDTWIEEQTGKLLSITPKVDAPPNRQQVRTFISSCVEKLSGGNEAKLARSLNIGQTTMRYWLYGITVPQLDYLLKLCDHSGIALDEVFITHSYDFRYAKHNTIGLPNKLSIPKFNYEHVKIELEQILEQSNHRPPMSFREVSEKVGFSRVTLQKHFPELCNRIVTQYRIRRREIGLENQELRKTAIKEAIIRLHSEGVYPSLRAVQKKCSITFFNFDVASLETWRGTLLMLGINQRLN